MPKVLGMPQVLRENLEKTNKLEIKDVDGYACVFVNGVQVYEVNPDIKISTNKKVPNKGVEVTLNFYAEINIEK